MTGISTLLAGCYQHSHRAGPALHPAQAMAQAGLGALTDAGIEPAAVQLIAAVEPLSWTYADLNQSVAQAMGLDADVEHLWVPAGGTSPQDLLHKIAQRIASGEIHCAVICGAESMRTRRRAAKLEQALEWPARATDVDPMRGQQPFSSELEARHGLRAPIHTFPLFENALRSAHGRSAEQQRALAAEILASNASVTAANPHAWFRDAPSAADIAEVSTDNRMIVYPYTKRMNAIMDVDQCAALVVVSAEFAQAHDLLGHCAAVLGGAGAEEIWNPLQRNTFSSCPAMELAIHTALQRAGIAADELDGMDLYSCFPSPIQFALQGMGLDAQRPLSLTGGLAFAGGPGNAYVLHSLAAALGHIRTFPEHRLLVTGIGMANTKHAATVLTGAGCAPANATGLASYREAHEEVPRSVIAEPAGDATIVTWTIEYDRQGDPVNVILILDLTEGGRTIANMEDSQSGAAGLLARDPIGRQGHVQHDAGTQRNYFEFRC